MANPIMNPRTYAQITGIALLATAALGVVMNLVDTTEPQGVLIQDFLVFDWTHNILHAVLGLIAITVGFTAGAGKYVRTYAQVFGVVYIGLSVAGMISASILDPIGVHLEMGEHLVHLLIGAWGLLVGFFGTTTTTKPTTMKA